VAGLYETCAWMVGAMEFTKEKGITLPYEMSGHPIKGFTVIVIEGALYGH